MDVMRDFAWSRSIFRTAPIMPIFHRLSCRPGRCPDRSASSGSPAERGNFAGVRLFFFVGVAFPDRYEPRRDSPHAGARCESSGDRSEGSGFPEECFAFPSHAADASQGDIADRQDSFLRVQAVAGACNRYGMKGRFRGPPSSFLTHLQRQAPGHAWREARRPWAGARGTPYRLQPGRAGCRRNR